MLKARMHNPIAGMQAAHSLVLDDSQRVVKSLCALPQAMCLPFRSGFRPDLFAPPTAHHINVLDERTVFPSMIIPLRV